MEPYHRDSLRDFRREAQKMPQKVRRGSRLFTILIILLFILAGVFFIVTGTGLDPRKTKDTILRWGDEIAAVFHQEENDITKTVDAVLAEQDAQV